MSETKGRWPGFVYAGGEEPDYRFSFANERTFLAWIRTGLALLAAGVAVDAFDLPFPATVQRTRARGAAPRGHYRIYVQNYRFHEPGQHPTLYKVEVEISGEICQQVLGGGEVSRGHRPAPPPTGRRRRAPESP